MAFDWLSFGVLTLVDWLLVFLLAKLFFKKSWSVSLGFSLLFVVINFAVTYPVMKIIQYLGWASFWSINIILPLISFLIIYLFVKYIEKFFVEKTFWKSLFFFVTYIILNAVWKVSLFVLVLKYAARLGGVA